MRSVSVTPIAPFLLISEDSDFIGRWDLKEYMVDRMLQ